MVKRLTASVLGCGLAATLLISGCSSPMPRQIEVSAKPIERPQLTLPQADRLSMRKVEWIILTEENVDKILADMSASGKRVALFALTEDGYEAIALNISDLRAYIQQQQAIIAAYEGYYQESNSAIDAANQQLEETTDRANQALKDQPTQSGFLGLFK